MTLPDDNTTLALLFSWLADALWALLLLALYARSERNLPRWLLGAAMLLWTLSWALLSLLRQTWGAGVADALYKPPGSYGPGVLPASVAYHLFTLLPGALALAAVLSGKPPERDGADPGPPARSVSGQRPQPLRILLLSCFTLGVYLWVYLFRAVGGVTAVLEARRRRRARSALLAWWALLVATTLAGLAALIPLATVRPDPWRPGASRALLLLAGAGAVFGLLYLGLVEEARRRLFLPARGRRLPLALAVVAALAAGAGSFLVLYRPPAALPAAAAALAAWTGLVLTAAARSARLYEKKPPATTPPAATPGAGG